MTLSLQFTLSTMQVLVDRKYIQCHVASGDIYICEGHVEVT